MAEINFYASIVTAVLLGLPIVIGAIKFGIDLRKMK